MPTERELQRRAEKSLQAPEDLDPRDLDREVRGELRSLSKETADVVARHLLAAERILPEDPQRGLAHAYAARAHAARIGVVREAVGVAAYLAGEWQVAIAELRAARRMSGSNGHLPLIADCERALGRPERALELARSKEALELDLGPRMELLIVAAGARRDLGQLDAAVLTLEVRELEHPSPEPWLPRLRYAYADCLLQVDRPEDAHRWFALAADVDPEDDTGAAERLLELDGIVIEEGDYDDSTDDSTDSFTGTDTQAGAGSDASDGPA